MEFLSSLTNGLFALAGIFIGSWLSSGRTRKEKLWDLRRAAYGVILSEMGSINRITAFADEMMNEQGNIVRAVSQGR